MLYNILMPKPKSPRLKIHLDLLKPQSNPVKIYLKLFQWLLSTGRYIFIFVEALVLLAFLARFKLDADLADLNTAIEAQKPYIQSLHSYDIRIRQTQLKLASIATIDSSNPDYAETIKRIADQTPFNIKINSLALEKDLAKIKIKINGESKSNSDIGFFIAGLKSDNYFSLINLASIGVEENTTKFTIDAQGTLQSGEKTL